MRAYVYLLVTSGGSSWHTSIDLQADRDHWNEVYHGHYGLRVLEPVLSFGQACRCIQAFTKRNGPNVTEANLQREAERLFPRQQLRNQWRWREWTPAFPIENDRAAHKLRGLFDEVSGLLAGRMLLPEEVESLLSERHIDIKGCTLPYLLQRLRLLGRIKLESAVAAAPAEGLLARMQGSGEQASCFRCGSRGTAGREEAGTAIRWSECAYCQGPCAYCEACLTMGRSRHCTPLIHTSLTGPDPGLVQAPRELSAYLASWGLSDVQAEAAGLALTFLKANESGMRDTQGKLGAVSRFLIWAVTGAGKTEMIFAPIQYMLERGGRVAVVTPRRDVVLELKPRLERAFPQAELAALYGGSGDRWARSRLTLATTHQMLRFRGAFDLVIVDEIDAYPYHNNPMLLHAVEQVCAPGGAYILLSATPPEALQREVKRGRLPHARVAARYHRHPLPEPKLLVGCPSLREMQRRGMARELKARLFASLERGAQVFVFVPHIASVEPLVAQLRREFPQLPIEGTSSKDTDRAEKVIAFRSGAIRLLVTTTILERGVTIPKSDVFVLEAGSSVFDAAALVQMAGRAGRSAQDPRGLVFFASKEKTRSQVSACRQIADMNAIARKKGYID